MWSDPLKEHYQPLNLLKTLLHDLHSKYCEAYIRIKQMKILLSEITLYFYKYFFPDSKRCFPAL